MQHGSTRQELYNLVWSEPMQNLAPRFGVSGVALAKTCRRADIPVPERGYWAKLRAGKTVIKRPLPPRGLGMSDVVTVGETPYETHEQFVSRLLNEPIPSPPTFSEDLAFATERIRKMVGKVSAPPTPTKLHPLVARLIDADDLRKQAQQRSPYHLLSGAPFFDSSSDRRRLRILNALFLALQRCGARPRLRDDQAHDTGVEVGQQTVAFTLGRVSERRISSGPGPGVSRKPVREKLRLTIGSGDARSRGRSWEDSKEGKLEKHLAEIVVELLVTAEANYRTGAMAAHAWHVEYRAELEETARRQKAEAERRERERLAKLEKERVERLLTEADNWRRAADLRAFVEAVRVAARANDPATTDRLENWATSVLALADRIDPVRAGRIPGPQSDWTPYGAPNTKAPPGQNDSP
jgi:hypothetical protein